MRQEWRIISRFCLHQSRQSLWQMMLMIPAKKSHGRRSDSYFFFNCLGSHNLQVEQFPRKNTQFMIKKVSSIGTEHICCTTAQSQRCPEVPDILINRTFFLMNLKPWGLGTSSTNLKRAMSLRLSLHASSINFVQIDRRKISHNQVDVLIDCFQTVALS